MTPLLPEVHAHDVLDLIDTHPGVYDRESLRATLHRRFGPDASYYACTASGMNVQELLEFLFEREKIAEHEGKLHFVRANACNH